MQWNLNGNGLSFLTDEEQAKVNASDNQRLRFRSSHHGIVDSDDQHLITADGRIIAQWGEAPEAAPTMAHPPLHVIPERAAPAAPPRTEPLTADELCNAIVDALADAVERKTGARPTSAGVMAALDLLANGD